MGAEVKAIKACIIDDDEIFVYGFKKLLQIRGIYADVLDFSNGQQALNYLSNPFFVDELPDVIFVDINMPVMDGWEFARNYEEIRHTLGKKIPLYAISSSAVLTDIERAKKNPVIEDYILKPVNESYIADIFNALLPAGHLQQIS